MMTRQEWTSLREDLVNAVQTFEKLYNENNCSFKLDRNAEEPDRCVVSPLGFKYKGFYVFNNDFFNIYIDGWYHNYLGWRTDFPRGYKSGLTKVIKDFCAEHNLYCELRKAYRDTCNTDANTCVFLIAINKEDN